MNNEYLKDFIKYEKSRRFRASCKAALRAVARFALVALIAGALGYIAGQRSRSMDAVGACLESGALGAYVIGNGPVNCLYE